MVGIYGIVAYLGPALIATLYVVDNGFKSQREHALFPLTLNKYRRFMVRFASRTL